MSPQQTVKDSSGVGGPQETFDSVQGQSQGPFGMSATVGPCSGASWGIHTAILSVSIAGLQGRFPRPDPQNTPRRGGSFPIHVHVPDQSTFTVWGTGLRLGGPFFSAELASFRMLHN